MHSLYTFILVALNLIVFYFVVDIKFPFLLYKPFAKRLSDPVRDNLALAFRDSQVEILNRYAQNAAQLPSNATVSFLKALSQITLPHIFGDLDRLQNVIRLLAWQDDIEDIGAIYSLYNISPTLSSFYNLACQQSGSKLACGIRLLNGIDEMRRIDGSKHP